MAGHSPNALFKRGVALLARRDYSRVEVERKLLRMLAPDEKADAVRPALNELQARGLLSDERLAREFVRLRCMRYGVKRVRLELLRRGVAIETITAALRDAAGGELEAARALWRRKFVVTNDSRERARQARFLAARGFPLSVISKVIGGLDDASSSD